MKARQWSMRRNSIAFVSKVHSKVEDMSIQAK